MMAQPPRGFADEPLDPKEDHGEPEDQLYEDPAADPDEIPDVEEREP